MAKTVLITGATGLLGRQVVKAFSRAGWEVKGTGFSRASLPLLKLDLNSQPDITTALEEIKYAAPTSKLLHLTLQTTSRNPLRSKPLPRQMRQ